jgi:6-phosphogluconolactonase/glucosamine-6-phosphate isomerase/deaminase
MRKETNNTTEYISPVIRYQKSRKEFDIAVGQDFIEAANEFHSKNDERFLVGLSHGQSPSGAYRYILENYHLLKKPELIRYTFINSPSKKLSKDINYLDANAFLHELQKRKLLEKENILGSSLHVTNIEDYCREFNERLSVYMQKYNKTGLDYVFVATNPEGTVAGIARNSSLFDSENIVELVTLNNEKRVTGTPEFLKKSKRIAFLATKADKRRSLVWLLDYNAKPKESPGFLRFMPEAEKRLIVFIDDEALTWPQVVISRRSSVGISTIRVDLSKPYNENATKKLPVLLMIHGFMGLNSFDGLLTHISTHKYIAAAMHYGSVPDKLPTDRYAAHVVNNIDAVVSYFGEKGHPVYILDHSMGNIFFLMMDRDYYQLKGIQKYLKGRIGANPFFGYESKQALLGFLDNVILPSMSILRNPIEKPLFLSMRNIIPIDTKKGVRRRSIALTDMLIRKDSAMRDRIWTNVKKRILYLMSSMDSLPPINRIPIEKALNRLPAKIFVIQIYSCLKESISFDGQQGLKNIQFPVLILKSDNDCIARYEPRFYIAENTEVMDVTDHDQQDLFKEHLYHMVFQDETIEIIDRFITKAEKENPSD